jgi:CRISPR-associated protein Csd1
MLLKHLYDFAVSRKLLDDWAFRRNTPVRWIIHLDRSGKLIGQGPQETLGPRKNKGHEYDVPKTTRATNSGMVADFLVDDIGAIFCLASDPSKPPKERAAAKLAAKHEDFWRQIRDAHRVTHDERFGALLAFHESLAGGPPPFLRPNAEKTGWIVTSSSGEESALGNDMLTFAVDTILFLDEPIREYWRSVHAKEAADAEGAARIGTCIVTGQTNVALARTHTPMVTGLPKPAKGTGAGIVGFESDAFRSYGFEKSYNAPASINASRGYLLALQYLAGNQNHWLPLGPVWLCFWAVESEEATNIFARLLKQPDPMSVTKFFKSPWAGLQKQPPDTEKFIATTLTATGPRIVVKAWVEMPIASAVKNLRAWFSDLEIESGRGELRDKPASEEDVFAPLAVKRLAGCAAPLTNKGKSLVPDEEKQRPDVAVQLYRAAIEGTAPSVFLIKPILDQLHSFLVRDAEYARNKLICDESRFALLKLILNRQPDRLMEIEPSLTTQSDDPAYNCGRLLAILAAAQNKAHEFQLGGAGVAERYFGTASVSPASVFPLLLRLNRHHLSKISKSERFRGHERFIQQQIESVLALFKPERAGLAPMFPRTLDLQAQGRFALGFYQQSAADTSARQANKKDSETVVAAAS